MGRERVRQTIQKPLTQKRLQTSNSCRILVVPVTNLRQSHEAPRKLVGDRNSLATQRPSVLGNRTPVPDEKVLKPVPHIVRNTMVSLKIENAPLTRVAPAAGAGRKAYIGTFRKGLAAAHHRHCGTVILHVGGVGRRRRGGVCGASESIASCCVSLLVQYLL